jgi:hypothetical protein
MGKGRGSSFSLTHLSLWRKAGTARVEKWLCSLPETALSANGWLLYWHGVALLCVDPRSSRASLEDAFARFTEDKDTSGQLLAWSSIVDSYLYGWDEFEPWTAGSLGSMDPGVRLLMWPRRRSGSRSLQVWQAP